MPTIKLPNGDFAQFPDDMPASEIESVLARQFPVDGGAAQDIPWGDVLKKAAGNTPASAGRFVRDIWNAVSSPIETGKALGNTALGYAMKAGGVEGEEQKYADALNKFFKERYGGLPEFKRAVAEDPVGVLGDISTVFTGVGGGLRAGTSVAAKAGAAGRALEMAQKAGSAASIAGKVTDPLNAIGKAAAFTTYPVRKLTSSALGLGDDIGIAERLYGSAVKPSPTLTPEERASVIKTGLDERILPNPKGYDKLRAAMSKTTGQVNDLLQNRDVLEAAGMLPPNIDPNQIAMPGGPAWEQAMRTHGNTVSPSAARKAIDSVFSDFVESHGANGPISTADAQRIKQATYAANEGAYGELTGAQKEANKALARGLKEGIAANVPEVGPLNERLGKLAELEPTIQSALGRGENRALWGLAPYAGGGVGAGLGAAIGGGPGAAIGSALGAGLTQAARDPANIARAAFAADGVNNARQAIMRGLGIIPATRQEILWPAYAGRMTEGGQ